MLFTGERKQKIKPDATWFGEYLTRYLFLAGAPNSRRTMLQVFC
jgi:hypothetical protein